MKTWVGMGLGFGFLQPRAEGEGDVRREAVA